MAKSVCRLSLLSRIGIPLFILCTVFSEGILAQWTVKNPVPPAEPLYSVCLTGENTAYAAGLHGTILKTSDGGMNWASLNTGTITLLKSVDFPSVTIGYAVGSNGVILKTTDAGITWNALNSGVQNELRAVFFLNESLGYVSGNYGMILKTTDGGNTWNQCHWSGAADLESLFFLDDQVGWACGQDGMIIKTANGGLGWTIQAYNIAGSLASVWFTDPMNGVAVGETKSPFNFMVRTTDGGATWTEVPMGTGLWDNGLQSVVFTSADTGLVSGCGGRILKTTDGGITWMNKPSGTGVTLNSLSFADGHAGFAVGDGGMLMKTSNGGETWSGTQSGPTPDINAITFTTSLKGYAVGEKMVLTTSDGGERWQTGFTSSFDEMTDIVFMDEDTGIISAYYFYWHYHMAAFLRTTDGGTNWETIGTGLSGWPVKCSFPDHDTGYAADYFGSILKTNDAGKSWFRAWNGTESRLLRGIFFMDPQIGYAVGNVYETGRIIRTIDGGSTWTVAADFAGKVLNAVWFTDPLHGVVVGEGGVIFRTQDGGNNWIQYLPLLVIEDLYAIHFPDAQTGYICGEGGIVLKTENGGLTWHYMNPTGQSLYSAWFLNASVGFVAGNGGAILKTTNGGGVSMEELVPVAATGLILYPNPARGTISVEMRQPVRGDVDLTICEITGRKVVSRRFHDLQRFDLDIHHLPAGIYLVRAQSNKGLETGKVVVY